MSLLSALKLVAEYWVWSHRRARAAITTHSSTVIQSWSASAFKNERPKGHRMTHGNRYYNPAALATCAHRHP